MNDFSGKVALVTGATSGIGKQVALRLGEGGAHVLVAGRDGARGAAVVDAIRAAGGAADLLTADLGSVADVRELAAEALRLGGGRIDILVNNAGRGVFGSTADTAADFETIFALNVRAPFELVAALAPGMADRGSGAIVNISTMVANFGHPAMALYGASKAALQQLTRAWAAEFGPRGVHVNTVSPGPTRTEGTERMGDGLDQLAATTPSGRPSQADEIAAAVVFLASDAARQINGALLPVDGGRIAI